MNGGHFLREKRRREVRRDATGRAHVLGLSGGKDSTALAVLMRERHPEIPMTYICTPTGDELPEMTAHWEKLERMLGRPIYHLVNRDSEGHVVTLHRLIDTFNALPNFRMRGCTRMLKIQPTEAFMRRLGDAVMYVGLRADEPEREGLFAEGIEVRFPLREWGMDEAAVWGALKERGIAIPRRTDCARCYHQRLVEWKALLVEHPDLYFEAAEQEARTSYTFRSPGRDTWPVSLIELARAFESGKVVRGEDAYWDRVESGEAPCRVCSL